jgi:Tfp pilus assembly major pilin PilA
LILALLIFNIASWPYIYPAKKKRLLETWSKQCKTRRKDDDANKMPRQDLLFPKKTSCARRENNLVRTNVETVVRLQSNPGDDNNNNNYIYFSRAPVMVT